MDLNPHRDVRSDALDDLRGDHEDHPPAPGEGARMAQRAAAIERQEDTFPPRAGLIDRIARWVRSLLGRR